MLTAPLHLIRKEVRGERAYRVPTDANAAAKLDQNESPLDLPEEVKRELVECYVAANWNRYPEDRPHELIAALADRLGHPKDGIIVGHGSNEIVHTIGLAMMGNGVPIVLPHPMFALYESVARMHGSHVVPVDPAGPHFGHNADDILNAALESNATLTVVTTPNNPTGQIIPFEGLERIAAGAPGFVLIDEAYVEFVEGPTADTLIKDHPNVLVMRTFSKAMGLAGLRLAYLLGTPEVIQEIEKARLPFLVDRGCEAIALALLDRTDLVANCVTMLKSECNRVLTELALHSEIETIPSAANFFLMRTPLAVGDLCEKMAGQSIRIRNVTAYRALAPSHDERGWVRVSIGTPEQNTAFLAALDMVLAETPAGIPSDL